MAVERITSGARTGGLFNMVIPKGLTDPTLEQWGISPAALKRAQQRAANKTAQWLKAHTVRELSNELNIMQKHIKKRLHISLARGKYMHAKMWLGTAGIDPLDLSLGVGSETAKGYKVDKHYFDQSFIAFYKTQETKFGIYKRNTSKRMPISKQKIAIKKQGELIVNRLLDRAEVVLLKKFKQELNYEKIKLGVV